MLNYSINLPRKQKDEIVRNITYLTAQDILPLYQIKIYIFLMKLMFFIGLIYLGECSMHRPINS